MPKRRTRKVEPKHEHQQALAILRQVLARQETLIHGMSEAEQVRDAFRRLSKLVNPPEDEPPQD